MNTLKIIAGSPIWLSKNIQRKQCLGEYKKLTGFLLS
jgi:hypothetical protein